MSSGHIKVLIVEHSPNAQDVLVKILESDPDLCILGIVAGNDEALNFISKSKPDLVALDIWLPGEESLNLTREIMARHPIPIVVLGSPSDSAEGGRAFDLLEAGALATVERPRQADNDGLGSCKEELLTTFKAMAEVKLVRRLRGRGAAMKSEPCKTPAAKQPEPELVAIGASTGGPGAIQLILRDLPKDFPVPIIISQHIARGFTGGFVKWLSTTTGFNVKVIAHNEKLIASTAYLCPEGYQTALTRDGRAKLKTCTHSDSTNTSISYLFDSIASTMGGRVIAVLLTGMGKDGAEELKRIRELGGITIAQDAATSLVHGMPGEAIRLGAAQHVMPCDKISALLVEKVCRAKRRTEYGTR